MLAGNGFHTDAVGSAGGRRPPSQHPSGRRNGSDYVGPARISRVSCSEPDGHVSPRWQHASVQPHSANVWVRIHAGVRERTLCKNGRCGAVAMGGWNWYVQHGIPHLADTARKHFAEVGTRPCCGGSDGSTGTLRGCAADVILHEVDSYPLRTCARVDR